VSRRGRATPGIDGLLIVDKPPGPTSHDAVAMVRRLLGQPRVGHAGTLDPGARGVLVMALGHATRLLEFLAGADKTYTGQIVLGAATDTYDDDGEMTAEADAAALGAADVEAALQAFRGEIMQQPPAVSAKKVGGRTAHSLSRQGRPPDLPAVAVRILDLALTRFSLGTRAVAEVTVTCGAGTYIRSLAHDLGAALGVGGHLRGLVRTRAGAFTLADAVGLDTLAAMDLEARRARLLPPRRAVAHLPCVTLPDELRTALWQGKALPFEGLAGDVAIVDAAGELLAVGRGDGLLVRPRKVLIEALGTAP
jgi:tRNA pseudouridine55 synthase